LGGVFMGVLNGTHSIVRFGNGELWHFYSVKNKGIFFRRLGLYGKWEEPVDLLLNTQEDFSIRIDSMDHLHLICRSVKGEMLYMHFNGRVWSRQALSQFDPVRYVIRYPVILPIKNQIHVLFAVGTAFNTGFWSLYHYYWNGTEWHSTEITKLTAGYRLSPFYTDLSDKYIHLVYRGLSSNKFQIFYCRYHLEHNIWSIPDNVTQSTVDCNTPSILIWNDRLHLVWTSITKNDLMVKYKSKAIRTQNKTDWSPEADLSKPGSNASLPNLVWADGKLWCIWSQTDTLFGCYSNDGGTTWSQQETIIGGEGNYHRIHYSTNSPQEKETIQLQWILGNTDETLFLPVVSKYIQLPEYNAEPLKAKADSLSKGSQFGVQTKDAQNKPSLENALFAELDKQEEYNNIVLSKLEEQSRLDEAILAETRETIALLRVNAEKLHVLLTGMEQIKNDIKLLQSKGLLSRLFK
jgi:hypothetical protein